MTVWLELPEILRPTAIIVENVPAVIHDKGQVVNRAQQALQDAGYSVAHTVLSLKWLGVPQRRKRHVMIGLYKAQQSLVASTDRGAHGDPTRISARRQMGNR